MPQHHRVMGLPSNWNFADFLRPQPWCDAGFINHIHEPLLKWRHGSMTHTYLHALHDFTIQWLHVIVHGIWPACWDCCSGDGKVYWDGKLIRIYLFLYSVVKWHLRMHAGLWVIIVQNPPPLIARFTLPITMTRDSQFSISKQGTILQPQRSLSSCRKYPLWLTTSKYNVPFPSTNERGLLHVLVTLLEII